MAFRIYEALAARLTLEHLGYTYHGGQLWKPPLGNTPTQEELYEIILEWDEGGGKRSRRELARRIKERLNKNGHE